MTFPETEVLNSLVARVFRIDDVTTLDPAKGQLLYIGVLGGRPSGWKKDAIEMGLAAK